MFFSKGKSKSTGKDVECEKHKKKINDLIAGEPACKEIDTEISDNDEEKVDEESDDEEEENDDSIRDEVDDGILKSQTSLDAWLNDINEKAKNLANAEDDGDRDNIMQNFKFADHLLRLCKLLPLWSCVNGKHFGIYQESSSANAESYFADLKLTMGDTIPCRVDLFLPQHMDLIDGMIKKASQRYITFVDASSMITPIEETEAEMSLSSIEFSNDCIASSSKLTLTPTKETETEISSSSIEPSNDCIACSNGDMPTGLHKCVQCNKNVHIFDGCSIGINDEEGCGEKRLCVQCATKVPNDQKKDGKERKVAPEMHETEGWDRSKNRNKKATYATPARNWNLNKNINKTTKVGLLQNAGNQPARKVQKKTISLKNTCAFDTIVQVRSKISSVQSSSNTVFPFLGNSSGMRVLYFI